MFFSNKLLDDTFRELQSRTGLQCCFGGSMLAAQAVLGCQAGCASSSAVDTFFALWRLAVSTRFLIWLARCCSIAQESLGAAVLTQPFLGFALTTAFTRRLLALKCRR